MTKIIFYSQEFVGLLMEDEEVRAQYHIMQKLYEELEEEREASATAAAEALSMIVRLQGEKAAQKMEACQYKRMVDEKMRHAEELVDIFEDMVHQKESEITSIKSQIQDVMKRLSQIASDGEAGEAKASKDFAYPFYTEDVIFQKTNKTCLEVENIEGISSCSTPTYSDQSNFKFNPEPNTEMSFGACKSAGGICGHHLKKLQMREKVVETTMRTTEIEMEDSMPQFTHSSVNFDGTLHTSRSYDSIPDETKPRDACLSSEAKVSKYLSDLDTSSTSYMETMSCTNTPISVNTHDIFEVPQNISVLRKNGKADKCNQQYEDSISKGSMDHLKGNVCSCDLCKMTTPKKEIISSVPDALTVRFSCADSNPSLVDIERIEKRLQKLEERISMHHEATDREQMNMLRHISEQLKVINTRSNEQEIKKSDSEDASFNSLMEAMISFSI